MVGVCEPLNNRIADMKQAALLVIDVQNGAFDGVRCPPISDADRLLSNARRLIDAAREAGAPVVFIQHCDTAGAFEEGTPHWQLHPMLSTHAGDAVVTKRQSSAFEGTDLSSVLATANATQLVLCGLQSEFCVSNTARSALANRFAVLIADDAHATWPSNGRSAGEISRHANAALEAAGAELRHTDEIVQRFRRSS